MPSSPDWHKEARALIEYTPPGKVEKRRMEEGEEVPTSRKFVLSFQPRPNKASTDSLAVVDLVPEATILEDKDHGML